MKKLFFLSLTFFYCVTSFSQYIDKEFEVTLYSFTKKQEDSYCYTAVGNQIKITPRTLDSDIRYKIRKDFQKKHSKENTIKVKDSYVYVRKNDWVVIVEHHLTNGYCKESKKLDMLRIRALKKGMNLTDELIDEKIKSSVIYLWNKDDNGYRGYKVLEKFQPYTDATDETSIIDTSRKLLFESMTDDEKSQFLKKYDAACMCVRG